MDLLNYLLPESILLVAAAVLFVVGASTQAAARRTTPVIAVLALVLAFLASILSSQPSDVFDRTHSIALTDFSLLIKAVSTGIAILFVLLAWPSSADGASNKSISYNTETGEYFALLLLAVAGMCVTAGAASLPTLFLGFELASIPTYIMVTMSRPQEQAQEAGVKYFFLGAAASAVVLLGMSYLFGITGEMQFNRIADALAAQPGHGALLMLAAVLMIVGFSFKLAAAPLHFYAGDVYQGAATPVTAAISFIPKLVGTVAILKVLQVIGGETWSFDPRLVKLLWIIAVLTMTVGNVLGLLQYNVKRVLAYSSIAHSGYILVGIATLATVTSAEARVQTLAAIAFYLTAYGIMNTAAFGVVMLIPARRQAPATTAETYDDIAGAGRTSPLLGLAMAVSCLSLIGVPTTVGFFGKFYILRPAILSGDSTLIWLAVITMVNATISAAYYLKIVGTMFARTDNADALPHEAVEREHSLPIGAAITLSVIAILALGIILPLTGCLFTHASAAVTSLSVR